jgi:hypothetical protein
MIKPTDAGNVLDGQLRIDGKAYPGSKPFFLGTGVAEGAVRKG